MGSDVSSLARHSVVGLAATAAVAAVAAAAAVTGVGRQTPRQTAGPSC